MAVLERLAKAWLASADARPPAWLSQLEEAIVVSRLPPWEGNSS